MLTIEGHTAEALEEIGLLKLWIKKTESPIPCDFSSCPFTAANKPCDKSLDYDFMECRIAWARQQAKHTTLPT